MGQPDSNIPNVENPMAWDRYAYVLNNPIRYTDPTGHYLDDGCETEGCSTKADGSTGTDPIPDDEAPFDETLGGNEKELDEGKGEPFDQNLNLLDWVPIVSNVRGVYYGYQVMAWAEDQPEFYYEQQEIQAWVDNCYGMCHYPESIAEYGLTYPSIGGPRPNTPLVDMFSQGMGEASSSVINLMIAAGVAKIPLSQTQVFSKGGTNWHLGLETQTNMNIIHIGNSSKHGIHLAVGAVKPFVADLHIYLQKAFPFFRIFRP